ncbi:hypothetical protein SEA_ATUIN_50 [Arthrobacter phage Atuin]|nr:hypothetical protein SEA_ATUIN_149 [Arthrobacter phage Atuin]
MPYQTQTERKVGYVDLRFYLKKETEVYLDEEGNIEESFDHYDIDYVERKKIKGVDDADISDLSESFGQVDAYHEFFQDEVPSCLAYGGTYRFRD